jgi:hypothetical protein
MDLMEYFKFDESDLNANRSGFLTEKQKNRLVDELKSARMKKTILAYFMFLLGAVGVIVAAPSSGLSQRLVGDCALVLELDLDWCGRLCTCLWA